MSSDDSKPYMDVLTNVSSEVRRYSGEIAQYVDSNFDRAADMLREQLASAPWIPEQVKIYLPKPRSSTTMELASKADMSFYERVQDWLVRHKILATVAVLFAGTLSYRAVRRSISARKYRRAKRAKNGARCEVVVIAASPALPVTQSLALDMERRGYMVYIVCGSAEDEQAVRHMSRPDIKPLSIDITDTAAASAALERFALYLHAPHAAVPGAKRSHLQLTGIILIPSLNYQTSPIATIPPANFADLFNTHLLHPILSIQAFLPLLTARTALQPGDKPPSILAAASGLSLAKIRQKASASASQEKKEKTPTPPKVLVFTPSIISSVNPPFHAPESTVCSALTAFTEVLAAELRPLAIPVTHIQLGTFDFTGFAPARSVTAHRSISGRMPLPAAETLSWSEPARHVYGRNFTAQSTSALGSGRAIRGVRGTSMHDLHHAVFDVLDGSNTNAIVRVGLGADLYGFVGSFVPRGLVAWMMGVRKVEDLSAWYQAPIPPTATSSVVSNNSDSPSPGRRSKRGGANGVIAVGSEVGDSHIWQ
ncbi:hypothetical protein SPBR_06994 [Sporothrix brasiliensis 5110]|uniref:DUF1776-domain-containing protein n=1 Tax=Sporothrix brasiliensis 5110 TaxID=1398154 RepID=A0A0C2IJW0_9PEZI|nr:uncharacterized protein SPBR_06994 [Sporothrix brasiliensis 5110]KIH89451.1 hypothetical protein SPBR_06994 [Sporothrix brasiliensis 5110]